MKRLFLIVFTIFICNNFYSQELPEIIPPSPTAYELGKYGQIPVGMFTGTPNVSIPLYVFKTKNLSVPISLSYNSNGIKVDQQSTNVGLGWSLNVNGVVTRIVRDEPDEENNILFPEDEIKTYGTMSPMALDFFYLAGNDSEADTEPDIFMYNFDGYSGKFIFDNNKKIIQIPHNNLKIEMFTEGEIVAFKITTPNGIEYYFIDQEINRHRLEGNQQYPPGKPVVTSWYLNKIAHPLGDEIYFNYGSEGYNYISNEYQNLTVPTSLYQETCSGSFSGGPVVSDFKSHLYVIGKKLTSISSNSPINGTVTFTSNNNNPEVSGLSLIEDILIKDEQLNLKESFNFNYLYTLNKRVFLEKVTFKDPEKYYAFNYEDPSNLVARLSKSQDHWGYYNGKNNQYYFPNSNTLELQQGHYLMNYYNIGSDKTADPNYSVKGLLKEIHYPTKGYTAFEYEGNSYYGTEKIYPPLIEVNLSVESDNDTPGQVVDSQVISNVKFDQDVELFKSVEFNSYVCEEFLNTNHNVATIKVINLTDPTKTNLFYQKSRGGNIGLGNSFNITPENDYPNTFLELKANNDYEISIKLIRTCNIAFLSLNYYSGFITVTPINKNSGGLRIKRVKNYDTANNQVELNRYYYSKKETPAVSSGEEGMPAYYLSKRTDRILCSGGVVSTIEQTYDVMNSNSLRPLYNASGNSNSYYKYVTVSHGGDDFENGGEEHEFFIEDDIQGNPLIGDVIQSAPWSNYGWNNGLEKKNTIFKKDNSNIVVLNELTNTYKQDSRYFEEVLGYAVQKKFDLILGADITYDCKLEDLTKTYKEYNCSANHNHNWTYSLILGHQICIAFGANNTYTIFSHRCNGKQVGTIITYPDQLENLDVLEYKTFSFWHYLESTIQKQYDSNGLNPVTSTTNYFYDNPNHLQLTRSESTNSKGELIKTKTYFPNDKDQLIGLTTESYTAIDSLIQQHRIAEPIQTEAYKIDNSVETLLSTQRTNYKDWGLNQVGTANILLPEIILTAKGTASLEDKIIFHSYYANGNGKEVSKKDGPHIVYIWGYQEQYPVAKVENATYADVSSFVSNIQTKSNLDVDAATEQTLRISLASLRTALPNSQVTTYTYDPLVGVTSITDPKGQTIYYHYNAFNRLEYVLDKDGKVISKNEYHYKSQ
ncbi:MAG: SpvB/TcaC N-terminal domain-containing protein [Lutibacter sp.]